MLTKPAELRVHAGCDRALQRLNDELERLRKRHSLLVAAAEQFRPLQAEIEMMHLRGDPGQARLVQAARTLLAVLNGEDG